MNKIVAFLEDASNRARIYAVAAVLIPVLVTAGALSDGVASTVLTVLAALLGVSVPALARKHTHKRA